MKALAWHGRRDVRVDDVPDPAIQTADDAIVRITTTAICGSDLHLYEVMGHVLPLDKGPEAYEKFQRKEDGFVKVLLKP